MKTSNKKIRRKSSSKRKKSVNNGSNRAMNNKILAQAHSYQENSQMEQASFLYQQVLENDPKNILALNGLGVIAMAAGMLSLAADFFRSASIINPSHTILIKNLAIVFTKLSFFDEAIQQYINLLKIDKYNGEAHGEIARLYSQDGDMKLALKHYKLAFEICPSDPRNIHGLVQLDAESITAEDINLIENYLLKHSLSLEDRCSFYFALGTYYDKREKFDQAFANFAVANISKGTVFDNTKHANDISDIINSFSSGIFEKYEDYDLNGSTQPVFIIGMPRSGTTLVEQIFAAHTDVYAAGELELINDISQKLKTHQSADKSGSISLENCDIEIINNFSRYYINASNNLALNENRKQPLRITDKMPANFMHLGLIALLFPNAHIVHCRRNPLDIALSCYFQNFTGNHAYSNNLENIAEYYQQYERLMSYWKQVLPIQIHTVDYETLVSDTESTSKDLIRFAGLDWQDNCTEFYKTNRHVNTASLIQVRKNIYHSSVDRWQNYDKYLNNLKKSLSILDYANETTRTAIINSKNENYSGKSCSYLH